MSVTLPLLNRVSADIEAFLDQRGMHAEAVRLRSCYGYRHCHERHCIKCASRRAYNQRRHLMKSLPALLEQSESYQLWFLTGSAADSPDVRTHARAAMTGMNRLLKHPRLKDRVIQHFSSLEVSHQRGRKDPSAHVHTLVVTRPMDKGKFRSSREEWIAMWEEGCSRPRLRVRESTKRKKPLGPHQHVSLMAKMIPRTSEDPVRVMRYCTKWATEKNIALDYRALLTPDPNVFFKRIDALKGIPRFSGPLHLA